MKKNSIFRWLRLILPIPLFILLLTSSAGAQIILPCAQDAVYPCKEVTPSYIETNNVLPLTGEGAFTTVTLPFPFTFYGQSYDTAYVRTNGLLSFVDTVSPLDNPTYFPNTGLPNNPGLPSLPNSAIYAFWDYLAVYADASVRTQELGTAPKRQFVIEWRNVTFADGVGTPFDFEIVLHETGAILLQYRNIDSGFETGSSATIGLENQAGTAAAVFSHNRPAIKIGEFAIQFGKAEKNVPVDIKPKRCPNPVNLARKGVLHVAILGTADVPVSAIDPKSVTLQGIAPRRWRVEDVGAPYEPFVGKTEIYNCNNDGPDGKPDLIFKFDTEDVVGTSGTLSTLQAGDAILLKLDGKLLDGTVIKGEDSVVIIRAHHKWEKEKAHHKKEKEKDHHKKGKDKDHDRDDDDDDDD